MRLLLVEDETSIARHIVSCLEAECFAVDVATDGEQGSFRARTNEYDLVILDNLLPKKTGKKVCEEIRAAGKEIPILILSALGAIEKKVELLNSGADDYLTKPFSTAELIARVRALLRRPCHTKLPRHQIGAITIDSRQHLVTLNNQPITLTKKEFMLLEFLMQNPGTALSRAMIMEHVWDINADPFSNTIESHIVSLRKKIDPNGRYILTVSGIGYKMAEH